MTHNEIVEGMKKYKPMVFALVRKYRRTQASKGVPRQYERDMLADGLDSLYDALCSWEGSATHGCCLNTYVYHRVNWAIVDSFRSKHRGRVWTVSLDRSRPTDETTHVRADNSPSSPKYVPTMRERLADLVRFLSDEARTVIDLVLMAPVEIAEEVTVLTRGRGRQAIRNYLQGQMGWDIGKVERAWAEVQEALTP